MRNLTLTAAMAALTGLSGAAGVAVAASPTSPVSAVLPTTSVLVIDEADREGSIGIKNTQSEPVLLYSKVQRLEDDDLDAALIPSPRVVLVQPGETQVVRLLFRSNKKLDKEHLARITFTGIPPKKDAPGRISFIIGQDLPVVIRPKGYTPVDNKWEYLKWQIKGQQLCVANDTKMAIRFVNNVLLLPKKTAIAMPKPYALPGSEHCAALPAGYQAGADTKVEFSAVSDYNYMLDGRQLPVAVSADPSNASSPSGT